MNDVPTTFPSDPGSSSDSVLNFKNICGFASNAEIAAATGASGVTTEKNSVSGGDDLVICNYDGAGKARPVAVLIYDPSQSVSYGRQPNDHGLNGFALEEPSADTKQSVAQASPAQQVALQERLATVVSWVYKSHPIRFRFGGPTSDNAKLIATAQLINSRLPA